MSEPFFDTKLVNIDKTWRIVRWWRRITGRSVVWQSWDRGTDYSACVTMEYDKVSGVYTVLKMEQYDHEA